MGRNGSEMPKVNSLTIKSLFDFRSLCYKIGDNLVDQTESKKNLMNSTRKGSHV